MIVMWNVWCVCVYTHTLWNICMGYTNTGMHTEIYPYIRYHYNYCYFLEKAIPVCGIVLLLTA